MASSVAPLGQTAASHVTLDALRLGRTAQVVVGRVIRVWDSRNVNKNGEFMGITALLLDEKDIVIHCFIPSHRCSLFRPFFKVGSILRLDRFEVSRIAHMYKVTEHQYMIRFIPATRVVAVEEDAPAIKDDKFMVRRFDHLQILANTNLELPDVVGEIRFVQGSDLNNESATTRVVVRLLIEKETIVYLSLWDEAASTFRGLLKAGDRAHSTMLVTTVNPKLFGGSMYLNSTQGTKFYFDPSIPEIAEFMQRNSDIPTNEYTCVDTLDGVDKKELVSIGDLNDFISTSTEQTQEADFLCQAQIVSVIQENGWSFISCSGCHRKLEKDGSVLICNRCVAPTVTGVVRYRVELAVDDGKDSAVFVVFDKEMRKLIKKDASTLTLEKEGEDDEEYFPACLEDLAGKEFVFQIRVTPFNFTPHHRSFTVSTIVAGPAVMDDNKATDGQIGVVSGREGYHAGSASGTGAYEKIGNTDGDGEKKRKRGSE